MSRHASRVARIDRADRRRAPTPPPRGSRSARNRRPQGRFTLRGFVTSCPSETASSRPASPAPCSRRVRLSLLWQPGQSRGRSPQHPRRDRGRGSRMGHQHRRCRAVNPWWVGNDGTDRPVHPGRTVAATAATGALRTPQFDKAARDTAAGPTRDRLASIGDVCRATVDEAWQTAKAGHALADALAMWIRPAQPQVAVPRPPPTAVQLCPLLGTRRPDGRGDRRCHSMPLAPPASRPRAPDDRPGRSGAKDQLDAPQRPTRRGGHPLRRALRGQLSARRVQRDRDRPRRRSPTSSRRSARRGADPRSRRRILVTARGPERGTQ